MHTRAARLALLILFLSSLATAAYLFSKSESIAATHTADARTFDASVRATERSLLEIRSAQRGYVGAGQGGELWAARVAQGVDSVRRAVASLRAGATSPDAQTALDAAASTLDDFVRVDKRAVEYVRRNQQLLASDVIFADGVELTDAALTSLERARSAELGARIDAADTAASRGVFAITAGAAAAVLAVLLLLPRTGTPRMAAPAADRAASVRPIEARRVEELAAAASVQAEAHARKDESERGEPAAETASLPEPPPVPAEEVDVGAAMADRPASTVAVTDFVGVASLCGDLARVVDTRALPSLLDRAASLLDASGIILWIADPDGRELNPIFAQGYPPQLINRLGTIPRDAENATAAAFRTSLLQTVMSDETSAGAIAAPLVTPGGCVGVMAAEVLHDSERQNMKLAAATIVAAQLATLVGPPARNHSKAGAAGA
jgi:CHASE3 domain sensor protein